MERIIGMRKGLTKYGDDEFALFCGKSFIKGAGYGDEALSRPVVGIINNGSDFNPCHGNTEELIERVKAGSRPRERYLWPFRPSACMNPFLSHLYVSA